MPNCENLTHLSESFGNLSALTTLDILYCNKLTHSVLPNSICFCKNLQSIYIQNINMLPPSMILLEKITKITVINENYIITTHNINEMRSQWYRILKNSCI